MELNYHEVTRELNLLSVREKYRNSVRRERNESEQKMYITFRDYYNRYKDKCILQRKPIKSFNAINREFRLIIEEMRRNGIKVIGDSNGYRLARDEEEWKKYIETKKRGIFNEIETLARCSNRTVPALVSEWFFSQKSKKINDSLQGSLF